MPGAGGDIDVRVDAALADELQFVQAIEQAARISVRSRINTSASVSFRRSARVSTSCTWSFQIVTSWPCQLFETGERAQRIVIIVEYRDLHFDDRPR